MSGPAYRLRYGYVPYSFSDRSKLFHKLPQLLVDDLPSDNRCCGICINTYGTTEGEQPPEQPVQLPCKHHFGWNCLDKWLEENSTCPLCRVSLFPNPCDTDHDQSTRQNEVRESFTAIESNNQERFSPELIRIIRGETRYRSDDQHEFAPIIRARRNARLYEHLEPNASNRIQYSVGMQIADLESNWLGLLGSRSYFTVAEEKIFELLEAKGSFDGLIFDLVKSVRGWSTFQLWAGMLHEGVYWDNDANDWRTESGRAFLN